MATVFQGKKGMLIGEFVKQGTTITSEVYCETLKETEWNADIQCSAPP
jgi:hypothetical protein